MTYKLQVEITKSSQKLDRVYSITTYFELKTIRLTLHSSAFFEQENIDVCLRISEGAQL